MKLIKSMEVLSRIDVGKFALFISIMSLFFAVSMGETKCLSASSCSVGDDEVFEGNLEVRSTNPVGTVLKSTTTSNQKTLELPDADGRLLSVPTSLLPFGADQFLKTDGSGVLTMEALDVKTVNIDGSQGTNGQFLKTDGTSNGVSWSDIPDTNETTFDSSNGTSGQILQVNASGSLSYNTLELDDINLTGSPSQNDEVRVDINGKLETYTPNPVNINETTFDSSNGTLDQYLRVNGSNSLSYDTLELDDITLTGATQGDSVRVDANGKLETYTASGGNSGLTRVAWGSGQKVRPTNTSTANGFVICWNGSANGKTFTTSPTGVNIGSLPYALDEDKRYKLVWEFNNTTSYSQGYNPFIKYRAIETDCHDDTNGHEQLGNQIFGTDQNITDMNYQQWYSPYNNYLNAHTSSTYYDSDWGTMTSFNQEGNGFTDQQGWCYPMGSNIPNYNANYPLAMANSWKAEHNFVKIGEVPGLFGGNYFGLYPITTQYGGAFDGFGAVDEFKIRNVVGQKYAGNNYISNGTHYKSEGTCFHKKPNFYFSYLKGLYIEVPSFNYAGYGTNGGQNNSPTGEFYIEWSLYEYDEEF
tara:strand:+ start:1500 stop:3254 length:1755 start_codon:yes stop_codon:yes gene_type:complete